MNLLKLTLVIVALSFFAIACGNNSPGTNQTSAVNSRPAAANTPAAASAPAPTPDQFAATRATYSQFCIRCHRADGTGGDFELEDGTKLKVPSLREHGLKDSDKHLADQILKGGDGMPAFKGKLEQERIDDLVRFIRVEFHGRDASGPPAPSTPAR